ncbi:ABC transporter permease [Petrotoga mexicana DSM 14811]|uniref:ABC transporter permease n=2 Tax=Petrotoga TaxID=28236 RepID=A0A2K1P6C3_9BACT|nr:MULTISPECIES: carbohydrate ABC transporter permease [Petrotoga]PNR98267.1 ABC transporter permease [Petrotoga mexicana DSM 14811]POZ92348.1 ABC transporter permease [Petrotoga halophila DSM 16923]
MKRSKRIQMYKILSYFLLIIISIIIAFPFYWLIVTSFKTYPEIYSYPLTYYPHDVTFEHFKEIMRLDIGKYFINSLIVSITTSILSLIIAVLPAYAFSRFSFRGKNSLLTSVLLFQMFPMVIFLMPIFNLLKNIGLLDTYLGLILSYIAFTTPITIIFLRGFFIDIPESLEEAAMIDGCSIFQAFYKIILPLTLPGIASVGTYTFLFTWSELLYSMSFLLSKSKQTIPTFLSLFVGQYQTRWGPLFAGSLLATIPPLIIFIILQRYFIKGLTSGAVKE